MDRIAKLKSFIEANPADLFSRHALAMEYVKMGEEDLAALEMRTLLDINPDYAGTYYHLGKLFERKGREDEARLVYEKGILVCEKLKELNNLRELKAALNMLDA
jgi:Tfp pilus assembly protein PilF